MEYEMRESAYLLAVAKAEKKVCSVFTGTLHKEMVKKRPIGPMDADQFADAISACASTAAKVVIQEGVSDPFSELQMPVMIHMAGTLLAAENFLDPNGPIRSKVHSPKEWDKFQAEQAAKGQFGGDSADMDLAKGSADIIVEMGGLATLAGLTEVLLKLKAGVSLMESRIKGHAENHPCPAARTTAREMIDTFAGANAIAEERAVTDKDVGELLTDMVSRLEVNNIFLGVRTSLHKD
jgi:hypothetical protein